MFVPTHPKSFGLLMGCFSRLDSGGTLPLGQVWDEGKTFKIGLIGCGGRGLEAAKDSLEAGPRLGFNVKRVAIADYFDKEVMADPDINTDRCQLTLRPSGEDFEKGAVDIPAENAPPRPGQKP